MFIQFHERVFGELAGFGGDADQDGALATVLGDAGPAGPGQFSLQRLDQGGKIQFQVRDMLDFDELPIQPVNSLGQEMGAMQAASS